PNTGSLATRRDTRLASRSLPHTGSLATRRDTRLASRSLPHTGSLATRRDTRLASRSLPHTGSLATRRDTRLASRSLRVEWLGVVGDVDLAAVSRRVDPDFLADLLADLHHEVEVLGEELLRVLASLPELLTLVGEPRARLLHDAEVDTDVQQRPLTADAFAIHDVKLCLAER